MTEQDTLFAVGWHKGEIDFAVRSLVRNLDYEHMRQLREMLVVGIGVMEEMWSSEQAEKQAEKP